MSKPISSEENDIEKLSTWNWWIMREVDKKLEPELCTIRKREPLWNQSRNVDFRFRRLKTKNKYQTSFWNSFVPFNIKALYDTLFS